MIFWNRQEKIERMLARYFEHTDACFERLAAAFTVYFSAGLGEEFKAAVNETHKAESKADDVRREIEYTLYGKALLPESRGDILGLLESFDLLPNIAEVVVFALFSQRVIIPQRWVAMFKQLVEVNVEAYHLARRTVDVLMTNPKVTLAAAKEVDQKESASDRIERELICEIFADPDTELAEKQLLKEIILLVGEISDRAEKVADRIGIIAIKRQI